MPPPVKPWRELGKPRKSTLISDVLKSVLPHIHDEGDFLGMFQHMLGTIAREAPFLVSAVKSCQSGLSSQKLVGSLAELRSQHDTGVTHRPVFSLNDLDQAVLGSEMARERLCDMGYNLSKHRLAQLRKTVPGSQEAASSKKTNLGGRPSMVHAASTIDLVRTSLAPRLRDSESIVVVGRGAKREMVVASLLTSPRYRVWREIPELHNAMGWHTFRRVLRIHFPHVRNPRRDTDVCKHCKHFSTQLLPQTQKLVNNIRAVLAQFCPAYFAAYDESELVKKLIAEKEAVAPIAALLRYIDNKNAQSAQDPLRQNFSRAQRLSLHTAEASAAHKLRPHVEILEAYEWHQVSAARQTAFVTKLRSGELPRQTALVQMDFKENVKYPMSPKETSEDWHAQNKLSLTVFGANAIVPKHPGLRD